jgi:Ger(x)C family germination protein
MKKPALLFGLICIPVFLTGCWDRTEINDLAIVVATAEDKAGKENYRVTVQAPLPSSLGGTGSSGGGGGTSGEGPFLVAQGTGKNLRQGVDDIQGRLSRKLYFPHRRVLILGEGLAKRGITESLNAILVEPQSRLSTYLLISKGDSVKMLEAQPRMEQFSGEAIREMAKARIEMTVRDAILDLERPGKEAVIPMIETTSLITNEKSKKEIAMKSFAVLKGDKLSFITNDDETRGVLWLREKMSEKSLTFPVSGNKNVTVNIIDNNIKQDFQILKGRPAFGLSVRATGTLINNEGNYRVEDPKTYQMVVDKMKKEIKNEIQSAINHAHSQGIDIFGFGWYLYRTHHQNWIKDWKNGWEDSLKELKVSVNVDADIQRTTTSGNVEKE